MTTVPRLATSVLFHGSATLKSVVIAGAGQSGFQAAASLRQGGFDGHIELIGAEAGVPYQRPPLSKAYLLGKTDREGLQFRAADFYADNTIALTHDDVISIDRAAKTVSLRSGTTRSYDHLVLATGSRNRPLSVPGNELNGVYGLKTVQDADALGARLEAAKAVVVIGAGFIGLEFAAVAAARNIEVHVVELAERAMSRALSAEMAAFFEAAHRQWGTQFHFGNSVTRINGPDGNVKSVDLADGRSIDAEIVLYGIGVLPNTELAAQAGIEVANGIVVDHHLLTSDPNISAIGDCAIFPSKHAGSHIRLESVQNAADHGRAVAARMLGTDQPYEMVPWFWSDQGDLKLQTVGIPIGHDASVTLGEQDARSFSILLFRAAALIAVESVNRPGDFMIARKILSDDSRKLTLSEAETGGFDLRTWASAKRA